MKGTQMKKILFFVLAVFLFFHKVSSQVQDYPLMIIDSLGVAGEKNSDFFYYPIDAERGPDGIIYLLDSGNDRIVKLDSTYTVIGQFGRRGEGPGEFMFPRLIGNPGYMTILKSGNIAVAENGRYKVQILDPSGRSLRSFHAFTTPDAIDSDSEGNIYLSQVFREKDHLIYVYNKEGELIRSFCEKVLTIPQYYHVNSVKFRIDDTTNHMYVINLAFGILQKYTLEGTLLWEKRYDPKKISKRIRQAQSWDLIPPEDFKENMKLPDDQDALFNQIDLDDNYLYIWHKLHFLLKLDKSGKVLACYYPPASMRNEERGIYNYRVINEELFYFSEYRVDVLKANQ